MMSPMIYSIGVLVEVDDAKTGYIIDIDNTETNNILFKINYTVLKYPISEGGEGREGCGLWTIR